MNKIKICFWVAIILQNIAYGQTKAITNTGRKVLLLDDGTWQYAKDSTYKKDTIETNSINFSRDKQAVFLAKSKTINVGIYFNPDEWSYSKPAGASPREYEFETKAHDCSASIVTETLQVDPLEKMLHIQFEKVQQVDPAAEIIKKEYRMVNEHRVLYMEIRWKLKTLGFISLGYFYSDQNGTVQVIASTYDKLLDSKYSILENFLNGLVISPTTVY